MCLERSIAVYHTTGAAGGAGTPIVIPDAAALGNIFKTVTTVNDTDQDIKVKYKTNNGNNGEFIVPKSIKGFTKTVKDNLDINSVVVVSLGAAAVGNITFNLSS